MQKRTREVVIWLTDAELYKLKGDVKKTGLSMQAYLRKLIYGIQPKELPQSDFFEVLKNLRQINNNMNQIAVKANSIGFIDTKAYWENMDELQKSISDIKDRLI